MTLYTNSSGSNAVGGGYITSAGQMNSTLSSVGGNLTLNGQNPIHIVGISGAISGRGASSTVSMHYAGVSSINFAAPASSSAQPQGYVSISVYLTGATSTTFGYTSSSGVYFGRSSTTGASGVSTSFGSFTGTLGMGYEYYQAPTAPLSPMVTRASTTSATLTWSVPTDDGGPGLTGYNIQASPVSDFSTGVVSTTATSGATSKTVTGLTANVSYYFRLAATNEVTDNYSTSSVWSTSVQMAQVITFPKVWNGTAWIRSTNWQVWNGTAWVVPQAIQIWNGSAWTAAV